MSHSDDKCLVLPPMIAPIHVVIIPVFKTPEEKQAVLKHLDPLINNLKKASLKLESQFLWDYNIPVSIKIDDDEAKSMGRKLNEYELQWVPIVIVAWPKDMETNNIVYQKRDRELSFQEQVSIMIPNTKILLLIMQMKNKPKALWDISSMTCMRCSKECLKGQRIWENQIRRWILGMNLPKHWESENLFWHIGTGQEKLKIRSRNSVKQQSDAYLTMLTAMIFTLKLEIVF